MNRETIPIWPTGVPCHHTGTPEGIPRIELFAPEGGSDAILVVFPGGGYHGHTAFERDPIARWGCSQGMLTAVVYYRVFPYNPYPATFLDGAEAMRVIRARAREAGLGDKPVILLGFSAGGHLAARTTVRPDAPEIRSCTNFPEERSAPDLLALVYPVISMITEPVVGVREGALGANPKTSDLNTESCELHTSPNCPPTCIIHAGDDPMVPVSHSLAFARSLRAQSVAVESHIFDHDVHGFGMKAEDPVGRLLPDLLSRWISQRLGKA